MRLVEALKVNPIVDVAGIDFELQYETPTRIKLSNMNNEDDDDGIYVANGRIRARAAKLRGSSTYAITTMIDALGCFVVHDQSINEADPQQFIDVAGDKTKGELIVFGLTCAWHAFVMRDLKYYGLQQYEDKAGALSFAVDGEDLSVKNAICSMFDAVSTVPVICKLEDITKDRAFDLHALAEHFKKHEGYFG
jgi:hypothetical protein